MKEEKPMPRTAAHAVALLVALFPAAALAEKTSVSTDVASYTDGDSTGYKPQKIVLVVNDMPDATRKVIEQGLVDTLGKRGVAAVPRPEAGSAAEGTDSTLTVTRDATTPSHSEFNASAVLTQPDGKTVWHAVITISPAGKEHRTAKALVGGIVSTLTADGHLAPLQEQAPVAKR
jgi:hypothetical protein